jgi:hypothetical protein
VKESVAVAPEARVAGLMLKAVNDTVTVAGTTVTDADVLLPPYPAVIWTVVVVDTVPA